MNYRYAQRRGVALYLTIVIAGVATLVLALAASTIAFGELEQGFTASQTAEVFSIADGCMDETLERIRLDSAYTATAFNLSMGNGSCTIDVVDLGGGQRRITVTGTKGQFNKTIESVITISGSTIQMDSWEELTT